MKITEDKSQVFDPCLAHVRGSINGYKTESVFKGPVVSITFTQLGSKPGPLTFCLFSARIQAWHYVLAQEIQTVNEIKLRFLFARSSGSTDNGCSGNENIKVPSPLLPQTV